MGGANHQEELWASPTEFSGNQVTQLLSAVLETEGGGSAESTRKTPKDVLTTYEGALRLDHEALRRAQRGALYSVLGHWTVQASGPATVVMPTGTGKTETMLALLVAARIERLLVLVPSDNLREQIAGKFERLGVLQKLGIIAETAALPSVGRMQHSFTEAAAAMEFAEACNVVVATPAVLNACAPEVRRSLLGAFSHLFIDEAHHVEAGTWAATREQFDDKPVVQFTATPFREDGKHLTGKIIYTYPLREAQRDGVFAPIDYYSVLDFDDTDAALAEKALERLCSDLDTGYDHLLMVRAKSIVRAKALAELYQRLGGEHQPVLMYSSLPAKQKKAALAALKSRASKVIICVNMLGEGFDLPALKIAAIHDPQKSLSVTLQFVGRFARTQQGESHLGSASVFVARPDDVLDTRLRSLYAEDAQWNDLLCDLSESSIADEVEVGDFDSGFSSQPHEIALSSLAPKMSTVVYRAPTSHWRPEAIYDFFGRENLLTDPIGINPRANVAWCVVEVQSAVRWGESKILNDTVYELFVLYFDDVQRLLYINNSANDGYFEDLAEHVLGEGAVKLDGTVAYRAMADVVRLVPTNVGLLEARNRFRRFSMYVGPDVIEGFPRTESNTKTQTHISASGFRDGSPVSISVSTKGRIWSTATAQTLKHWRDWCDEIGRRLLDSTLSIDHIMKNFIIPEMVKERPDAAVLGLEWPPDFYLAITDPIQIDWNGCSHPIACLDLRSANDTTTGPIYFDVATDNASIRYRLDISDGKLTYTTTASPEPVVRRRGERVGTLSEWFNRFGLIIHFGDDQMLGDDGQLFKVDHTKTPLPRETLSVLDWTGTDLKIESQVDNKTKTRRPNSVQSRAIQGLLSERAWDFVLDDDGAGEIADIVAVARVDDMLLVRLVHCKYSGEDKPGARVKDLYEVCGQAIKSTRWRHNISKMFQRLEKRARDKNQRQGFSPFEAGGIRELRRTADQAKLLRPQFEITIVQPGLSQKSASDEQLTILGSAELYLQQTAGATFAVCCSA